MKDALIECCSILGVSNSRDTESAAAGKRIASDPEFKYWLELFLMLTKFSWLQSNNIDAGKANASLNSFTPAVHKLRDGCNAPSLEQKQKKI